ncbi:WD40 repeat domain-containing protein [Streptomyces chartreusis]|uniref:WD40 repeat domain-containing protein n=1 Tax=Streptomyces chartreusis TaxID=1969 RepID=UPI0036FF8381
MKDLPKDALTSRERAFLDASERAEQAEALHARHRVRRRRRLVAALAVLLVCAVSAVGFAVRTQQIVDAQRNHVLALKAVENSMALRTRDSSLAVQLALAAHQVESTQATRNGLLGVLPRTLTGHVRAMAVTLDGRTLATAHDDAALRLWDLTDPHRPVHLGTHHDHNKSAAHSPDSGCPPAPLPAPLLPPPSPYGIPVGRVRPAPPPAAGPTRRPHRRDPLSGVHP